MSSPAPVPLHQEEPVFGDALVYVQLPWKSLATIFLSAWFTNHDFFYFVGFIIIQKGTAIFLTNLWYWES